MSTAVQAFTSPGEKVFLHSPTYIGFSHLLQPPQSLRPGHAHIHDPWGIRMNLALPHSLVREAMGRLKDYVFAFE